MIVMITTAFGAGLGFVSDVATGAINNAYARQNAEENYQRQLQFWEIQNQYNSPYHQRLRMEEAGINPNTVYSNGSLQNTADGAPATASNKYADSGVVKMHMMQQMMQLGLMQADIKLKDSQAKAQLAQAGVSDSQTALNNFTLNFEQGVAELRKLGIASENDLKKSTTYLNLIKMGDLSATQPYRIKALEGQIKQYTANAEYLRKQGKLSDAQYDKVQQEIDNLKQTYRSLKILADYETDNGNVPLAMLSRPGLWGSGIHTSSISGGSRRVSSFVRDVNSFVAPPPPPPKNASSEDKRKWQKEVLAYYKMNKRFNFIWNMF